MSILNTVSEAGFIVSSSNGEVDLDSTVAKLRSALAEEIARTKARDEKIEALVDAQFDAEGGGLIDTGTLTFAVAHALVGGDMKQIRGASADVAAFLKRSPRFSGKRGAGGGMQRLSTK